MKKVLSNKGEIKNIFINDCDPDKHYVARRHYGSPLTLDRELLCIHHYSQGWFWVNIKKSCISDESTVKPEIFLEKVLELKISGEWSIYEFDTIDEAISYAIEVE